MNIENKALRPDIVCGHKKRKKKKTALLIEVSVPSDFGRNDAEIKKMSKYHDLKNGVKRSWNLESAKIVPVIDAAVGNDK